MSVPAGTRFIGILPGVDMVERKSTQANSPTEVYTIEDIKSGGVPYVGATQNVDLGEYELKAGQIELDQSPTGTAGVAVTRWNDTIGSTETTLKGGSVILKNGVDLVARVVNKVTPNATLTKAAYQVVKISGAQGQRLAVGYAQANNDNNSADTLGVVIETIATNQEGFIMTVGQLEGVNTTGSLQGETWADGDVLYLSPTVPGAVTKVKPNGSTGHIVIIGYVEYAHANNGKIYVKIMNGWELDELHNVYINPATLVNNQVLTYESSTQLWKNQTPNTGITVGTTSSSGTNGRVFFQAGGVVQQSANLFWDNSNNRLGIGTASPTTAIDVNGTIRVDNTSFTGNALTIAKTANNTTRITAGPGGAEYIQFGASNLITLNANVVSVSAALAIGTSIFSTIGDTIGLPVNNTFAIQNNAVRTGMTFQNISWGNAGAGGTSTINAVKISPTANFSVGTTTDTVLLLDPVINTTGGTHTIRGLYYNPTLTSTTGTTHRAIETTTGDVIFASTSGNVAIGSSSPGARLDVRAQGALSTDIAFRVRNSADSANLTNINGNGGFKIGLDNAYHISLDPTSPSLRGQNGAIVAWQLSPWTGEHGWLTSNSTNQNLIGIGTTSPTDKLHIYNIVNDYRIRIAVAAGNPADESCGIRFTTTWAGTSFGADAANLVVRTKGTNNLTTQRTALEFRMNALGTSALRASLTSQSNFLLQSPTEDTNDIGVIYIPNGTAPTVALAGGGKLYVEGGALKYIGSAGTISVIAPA